MMNKLNEESIKARIKEEYFKTFKVEHEHYIDFAIYQDIKGTRYHYLLAEAKKGDSDILASLAQLILSIGKRSLKCPSFLAAFDAYKFALLPSFEIIDIFSLNDFNWQVTPSDHKSKEFMYILDILKSKESLINVFYYAKHKKELKEFIKNNFNPSNTIDFKIQIDKNNFKNVYLDWLDIVKPSIVCNWSLESPYIIEADFFIADLLSQDNKTEQIRQNLRILLESDKYKVKDTYIIRDQKKQIFEEFSFSDNQKAHKQFWARYHRPPKEEVQDYIIARRDLLVPQDIRERKGAFFTPRIWVKKAQEYLASALGENFQDEYIIWDLAAGSGNLLIGLNNKYKIYASTLDASDVDGMKDRIKNKSLDLLENHIFQFDFLNDSFDKLPISLQEIIKDDKKRKKLIIFINPPYAEATSSKSISIKNDNTHKAEVATQTKIYKDYLDLIGLSARELFAQFFIRIYKEIPNCILASFSKLKYVNSQNFIKFRSIFKARFLRGFICPAYTFDNVKGSFPIGFVIWDTKIKEEFKEIKVDVYDEDDRYLGDKGFYTQETNYKNIKDWLRNYNNKYFVEDSEKLGHLVRGSVDFQNNNVVFMTLKPSQSIINASNENSIYKENLIINCIFVAVRHAIKATWLNDRDQFLYPNDGWITDIEFQNDCLAFALFSSQNRISAKDGINHFIPFSESELSPKEAFKSNFMYKFINGKIKKDKSDSLINDDYNFIPSSPLVFSLEALEVFDIAKRLFIYYHSFDSSEANASLYDIKAHFQGYNDKGRMNPPIKAKDEYYKATLGSLNLALKALAAKIEPKIYKYGFLKY